jgi:hypothetical protein
LALNGTVRILGQRKKRPGLLRHPASGTNRRIHATRFLDRRIGERDVLEAEIKEWQHQRNASGARIQWKFTTQKARDKLARAYPNTI